MSGFIGYKIGTTKLNHTELIQNSLDLIKHRGPDGSEICIGDQYVLGSRFLKLFDTDEMVKKFELDSNIKIVFDGEIFNKKELINELKNESIAFETDTYEELIIRGYQKYGANFVEKFRGTFAYVLFDQEKDILIMVRDPFGVKPLYYSKHTHDKTFIFGSEIKAFLSHPSFIKEVNKDALRPYLTLQYSAMDETFFKGVYKLKPAHYLIIENDKETEVKYWDNKFNPVDGSLEDYVAEIKETVSQSVITHKNGQEDVGSFLSGGVDSSYIAALLKPKETYSVGFDKYESLFNETNIAQDLSKELGFNNKRKFVSAEETFKALPTIQYYMDEPQSNPSSIPLYFLAELASKDARVVMSGEGADELFGGYASYQKTAKEAQYAKVPFSIRRGIAKLTKSLPQNRITTILTKGGLTVEESFVGEANVFKETDALKVLKPAYKNGPSVKDITSKVFNEVKNEDDITKMQYLDLQLWLPGDILLKADSMSMAHSLVVRMPFLDKEVMTLAKKIPTSYRVRGSDDKDTKLALRTAAKEVLPEAWARRPKVGFPVPIRHWFRQEEYYLLVKEMYETDFAKEFFNTDELIKYLNDHYEGKENNGRYIWTSYIFLVWYKRFFIDM